MELRKDIWRPFIVAAPIEDILARGSLEGFALHPLPASRDLAYSADPFGIWREGRLHVFVEAFDYRDAHGRIEVHVFDEALRLLSSGSVLSEPWHLSYPFVFEADGETWMLPEACASNTLTLYRAAAFPHEWVPHRTIALDVTPIDATPVQWQGRWWLFYAPAGTAAERLTHLHAAWADSLDGVWSPHPANPILVDPKGARPGGRALASPDAIVLPVQDCSDSYGSGLRLISITDLGPEHCTVQTGPLWQSPASAGIYRQGFHTLSAAGPVTLVDFKRRRFSLAGLTMRPRRDLAALLRRFVPDR